MLASLGQRLVDSLRSLRAVFANPNLRRLELAWAGSNVGGWAYGIAVAVYAYEVDGAAAVGIVGFIRMLVAAVASPLLGALGDRYSRRLVMAASDISRVVTLGAAAAVALAGGSALLVYALTVVVAIASTAFRPAQAAIVPSLATKPDELAAANVASSMIESLGIFVGPALGGLLLAVSSPGVVFAVTAAAFLWSALLVLRIHVPGRMESEQAPSRSLAHEALAGFQTIVREPRLRLLVGLFSAQTFVSGLLNVLLVVTALRLLELGESGVGYLNSAVGVGGLLGAAAALALVGQRALAVAFGAGIVLWGAPIALIGVWPNAAAALLLLGIVGLGNTLVDVAGFTLLQRAVPDALLARAFGVLESLILASVAVGSAVAPALISGLGIRLSLVFTGCLLPALVLLTWRGLSSIDADATVPQRQIALLRGVPFLDALPTPTLEQLASSLRPLRVGSGETVFSQGDAGDRFYVVDRGDVELASNGRKVGRFGAGYYFGEIALLRDVPRTGTVTALSDLDLYALERDEFISAVTGHPSSVGEADAAVARRLQGLRASAASL